MAGIAKDELYLTPKKRADIKKAAEKVVKLLDKDGLESVNKKVAGVLKNDNTSDIDYIPPRPPPF